MFSKFYPKIDAKSKNSMIFSCHIYALVNDDFSEKFDTYEFPSIDQTNGVRENPIISENSENVSRSTKGPDKDVFAKKPTKKAELENCMP